MSVSDVLITVIIIGPSIVQDLLLSLSKPLAPSVPFRLLHLSRQHTRCGKCAVKAVYK